MQGENSPVGFNLVGFLDNTDCSYGISMKNYIESVLRRFNKPLYIYMLYEAKHNLEISFAYMPYKE